jgi:hypothetical protein
VRSDRNTKAEPGFIKRRNRINEAFSPRTIEMLKSPAYRALSLSAHRVISRIEIELSSHGGNDNGRLPVTKLDFMEYGVSARLVAAAIREAQALGFIEVTERERFNSRNNGSQKQKASITKWPRYRTHLVLPKIEIPRTHLVVLQRRVT